MLIKWKHFKQKPMPLSVWHLIYQIKVKTTRIEAISLQLNSRIFSASVFTRITSKRSKAHRNRTATIARPPQPYIGLNNYSPLAIKTSRRKQRQQIDSRPHLPSTVPITRLLPRSRLRVRLQWKSMTLDSGVFARTRQIWRQTQKRAISTVIMAVQIT